MDHRQLIGQFLTTFGRVDGIRVFEAPGCINLIGDYTEYNGGLVLPVAMGRTNTILARKRNDELIKLAATFLPDRITASERTLANYRHVSWGNFLLGTAYCMQEEGFAIPGCEMLYHCTIPFGAGLASSSAMEVSTALALSCLADDFIDPVHAALLAQKAEVTYVGAECGIMDSFVSSMSKKGFALQLDCGYLHHEFIPVNLANYKIIVIITNKPRNLAESPYGVRRKECELALQWLQNGNGEPQFLCNLSADELEANRDRIPDHVIYRRVRHVVHENNRVRLAAAALAQNDLKKFGELLCASHESLRDDFAVTCPELDLLFDVGNRLPGVIAVRMMGAGFGGSAVAIVRQDNTEDFIGKLSKAYEKAFGYTATFLVCDTAYGAREITSELE